MPVTAHRPAGVAMLVVTLAAAPVAAGVLPTFATYSSGAAGSLDGVGFTMSGLSAAGFGSDIQNLSMSGTDWNGVGNQQGRIYNQITASSFTITFDSAVSGLQMYLYYFRAAWDGYDSYTFSEAFTITGGLTNVGLSGNTLDTSSGLFASGVISFSGPVTSLTVTTTGTATGGDAGFTLATLPSTPAVPGVGGLAAVVGGSLLARRRRR